MNRDYNQQIVMKDLTQFSKVYLVPLADFHIGCRESNLSKINGYINWIKERDNAFTILNGDLMNAATKDSTPELYEDLVTPDDAYNQLRAILEPIKDKILAISRGGHEGMIFRKVGADYMARLAYDLGDIPYKPEGGMVGLKLSKNGHTAVFFTYFTHGWGGARTIGAKVKKVDELVFAAEADCHHPYTKVLRGNMVWDELGNIDVGDEVIGISEYPEFNKARQVLHTTVTDKWSKKSRRLRMVLEDGTSLITTPGHLWLAKRRHGGSKLGGRYNWFRTDKLSVRDELLRVYPVWETKDNWETGYIAGLLDGEGSITVSERHRSRQLAFSQKEGLVLSIMENYLNEYGVGYRKNVRDNDVANLLVRVDAPKLLGMTQPKRLAGKGRILVEKRLHKPVVLKIVAIEPWGEGEVIALETDARTFLTEGVATHNCYVLSHDHTQNARRLNRLCPPRSRLGLKNVYLQTHRQLLINTGGFINYSGYIQRKGYSPQDIGTPRIRMELKKNNRGYEKDLHCSL